MEWTDNYDRLCSSDRRAERAFALPRSGERLRTGLSVTDAVVMWSTDAVNFTVGEEAFLTPGPEHEMNWVYGSCYLARGMVETPGRRGDAKELSFYPYVGRFSGNATELDRYVLRTDGFVSYHAGAEPRRLVTKPLVFDGEEMLVNFATSAYGYLKILVRGENGETAESGELFGDAVDRLVGFKPGALAKFAGRPVTVTFEISDGDVYSYRFRKVPPALVAADGRTAFKIAVDASADKAVLFAAEELKTHLEEATGATFAIVTNGPARVTGPTFEVGTSRAKDLVGRLRLDGFAEGEAAAVYKDGSIALAGKGTEGATAAVRLFLGKAVPKHGRIEFKSLDLHAKPSEGLSPAQDPIPSKRIER